MQFEMVSLFLRPVEPTRFTETTAPKWLCEGENAWFWKKHVLTLGVGEVIETDFQRITRVS